MLLCPQYEGIIFKGHRAPSDVRGLAKVRPDPVERGQREGAEIQVTAARGRCTRSDARAWPLGVHVLQCRGLRKSMQQLVEIHLARCC